MAITYITEAPIDVAALRADLADIHRGGVVTFEGVVRATTGDVRTDHLIYEHHPTLAERELARIAERAEVEFGAHVTAVHRVGRLVPGDVAVVCIAASAHRAAAFRATEYLIDAIKQSVPIWKREFGPAGTFWPTP